MVGRIPLIAASMLLGLCVAQSTSAQEEPARGRLPLGERLQRLRSDIFGDAERHETPTPAAPARAVPRAPSPAGGTAAEAAGQAAVSDEPRAGTDAAPQRPYVTVPSYLKTQGARPARAAARAPRFGEPGAQVPETSTLTPQIKRAAPSVRPSNQDAAASGWPDSPEVEALPSSGLPTLAEEIPEAPEPDDSPLDAAPLEEAPLEDEASPEPTLADPSDEPAALEEEMSDELPEVDQVEEVMALDADVVEDEDEPLGGDTNGRESGGEHGRPSIGPAFDDAAPRRRPARTPGNAMPADPQGVLFRSHSPVLAVEASGPRTVTIGKEADFVVTLRNTGAAANHVVVSIHMPATADVAAAKATRGNAQAAGGGDARGVLEWTIDHLAADSEERLALKLIPRDGAPLDLAFRWTFAAEPTQAMVQVQEPKLEMSLAGPNEVLYGETKLYKLTISNPGNGDTENVSVGLLPIGRAGDAPASHRLGTLRAGESKTIDIELTARQAGAITIKAQAFADAGLRAEASEQVLVRRASLQVEVEAPRVKYAGTDGTYRVKVANVGNAMADNVHVAAVLPPEARFVSASSGGTFEAQQGRVLWKAGALQAGGERVFELQCALNNPGDNRVQFVAEANGDLSATANANTQVEAIADLKLDVRDPQGPVAVGEEALYEVSIRNRGTKAAENVELVVFFSEGLEASSADGGAHDIGPGQVVFRPIAVVAAGSEAVFHIRSRAGVNGNHVFRAEVNCPSLNVKLATEEVTHFYGEPRRAAADLPAAIPGPSAATDPYADDPPPAAGQ